MADRCAALRPESYNGDRLYAEMVVYYFHVMRETKSTTARGGSIIELCCSAGVEA